MPLNTADLAGEQARAGRPAARRSRQAWLKKRQRQRAAAVGDDRPRGSCRWRARIGRRPTLRDLGHAPSRPRPGRGRAGRSARRARRTGAGSGAAGRRRSAGPSAVVQRLRGLAGRRRRGSGVSSVGHYSTPISSGTSRLRRRRARETSTPGWSRRDLPLQPRRPAPASAAASTSVTSSPPADSSRSSSSPATGAGRAPIDHHLAVDQPEHVAGLARPGHGQRLPRGDGHLGPPGRRRGLGHRDHVVAEAAGRVVHGDRGQPLHRRPGRHDGDLDAGVPGPGGGGVGGRGQLGPAGQHDRGAGAGGQHRRQHRVLGAVGEQHALGREQLGQAGARRRPRRPRCPRRRAGGSSANRVTVIRYGRPAWTPASIAAPTSLTCTCTVQVPVAGADDDQRVAELGQLGPQAGRRPAASSRYCTS